LFPEFHDALLMAGGAEMATFARKWEKVFVAAVLAFDAGETVVQIAAIKIPVYHLLDIRPPEAILLRKMLIINLYEGLEAVLDAAVIIRILRMAGPVNADRQRHIPPGLIRAHNAAPER
jgi:hypothetical protein